MINEFSYPSFTTVYNKQLKQQKSKTVLLLLQLIAIMSPCRNSVNSASGLKSAVTIEFSDHDFLQRC